MDVKLLFKNKVSALFPMDFYGECQQWRFAVRANQPSEVLDALIWRAFLSMHRQHFHLHSIAVASFGYEADYDGGCIIQSAYKHHTAVKVKKLGPVVEVVTLNEAFLIEQDDEI